MATITTRSGKGSPLTNTEVDENFTNLNTDKIENVVDDTSPELGGNLSLNGNNITGSGNITLGDSQYVAVGASNDLQIGYAGFYNGSYIDSANTLYLSSSSILGLMKGNPAWVSGAEYMAKFTPDGSAELYYDNASKLATTSTGIDVTGEVQCDSLDVDGAIDLDTTSSGYAVNLESTSTSTSNSGPDIYLYRNNSVYPTYPNTPSGKITFASRHQYAQFAHSEILAVKVSGIVPGYHGYLAFRNADATSTTMVERMRMSKDGITINISGDPDTDFKVESDSNEHMLFVDASADAIGINNSSPSCELDVTGTIKEDGVTIKARALVMALAFG